MWTLPGPGSPLRTPGSGTLRAAPPRWPCPGSPSSHDWGVHSSWPPPARSLRVPISPFFPPLPPSSPPSSLPSSPPSSPLLSLALAALARAREPGGGSRAKDISGPGSLSRCQLRSLHLEELWLRRRTPRTAGPTDALTTSVASSRCLLLRLCH
jgi:hypothetical protein